MKNNKTDPVSVISAGLFVTGVDLILFAASFGLNLYAAGFSHKGIVKILRNSFELAAFFREKLLNFGTAYARKKDYLENRRRDLVLTRAGRERLKRLLPRYRKNRPWDGRLHLITYDIKETKKEKRQQLARWLAAHRAVKLQKSVWISVADLSRELRQENLIYQDEGIVLISSLKSSEGIGGKTVQELVEQWYHLFELNRRYDNLLLLFKEKKFLTKEEKFIIKMRYLKILKDDPQLPRQLLPKNWQGDVVYNYINQLSIEN